MDSIVLNHLLLLLLLLWETRNILTEIGVQWSTKWQITITHDIKAKKSGMFDQTYI